ncbi:MAG: hypothetical protein H5U13_11680 [Parvibaculum sp.]|nr:hypothetical protein [Parvibaculum sp.]
MRPENGGQSIRMAGEKKRKPRRAPLTGEHTRAVLAYCEFGEDEIARMIESGAAAG